MHLGGNESSKKVAFGWVGSSETLTIVQLGKDHSNKTEQHIPLVKIPPLDSPRVKSRQHKKNISM